MNRIAADRHAGFTLIELVVAFAITSLMIGTLYSVWGTALKRSERARAQTLAVLHAESLLERMGIEWPFDPTRTGEWAAGDDIPFRYEITATPVSAEEFKRATIPAPPGTPPPTPPNATSRAPGNGVGTATTETTDEPPLAYRVAVVVTSPKLGNPATLNRLYLNTRAEPTEGR